MSMKIGGHGAGVPAGVIAGTGAGFIDGMGLDNDESNTQAFIKTGSCLDSTNTELITVDSRITVDITVSGVGGLDTGSESSLTWYAVHAISGGGNSVDGIFSLSATAPTLPGTYTVFRFQGWRRNDSGSDFLNQTDTGLGRTRTVVYNESRGAVLILSGSNTSTTFADVDCTAYVPPSIGKMRFDGFATISGAGLRQMTFRAKGSIAISQVAINLGVAGTFMDYGENTITFDKTGANAQVFQYLVVSGDSLTQVNMAEYTLEL